MKPGGNDTRRPLPSDLHVLVHEWIRMHEGFSTESIAKEMMEENSLLDHDELVNAVEFLVWNDYAARDKHMRILYRE